MTFRHPLRNEWDTHKAAFVATALKPNDEGAMARGMLAIVPAFLDFLEAERDRSTRPAAMFAATASVCGLLIENVIETRNAAMPPRQALEAMLTTIHRVVAPKVVSRRDQRGIIVPGAAGWTL